MNYEKKYKEALEKASKLRVQNPFDTVGQMVEHIFPELKKNEDERIKNLIYCLIRDRNDNGKLLEQNGVTVEEALAWLEKQGEERTVNYPIEGMFPYTEPADTLDGEIENIWNKLRNCDNTFTAAKSGFYEVIHHFANWLEKQGEQKATDEVKPKFNVGDWISGYYTSYQVLSINNEGYVVEDIDGNKINILFENEKFHHLWTIKDAKDGDVVVVPSIEGSEHSEQIFIFKEIKNRDYVKNVVEYYCRVCDNEFYVNERGFMGYADDYFVPSTQEQQKLLFQKMKEAGYEWNSEKKELKKISQRIVSAEVKEALYDKPTDEEMKELLRTEYEKGRADTIAEMKSSWSEEDEKILNNLIDHIKVDDALQYSEKQVVDWLESIKQRIGG